jgi:hypothetical protein
VGFEVISPLDKIRVGDWVRLDFQLENLEGVALFGEYGKIWQKFDLYKLSPSLLLLYLLR